MVKKAIKIEFDDGVGGKYKICLEGKVSRDKMIQIIDMVELIENKDNINQKLNISSNTQFGKIYNLIEKKFNLGSFTSSDILEAYEDEYNIPIKLSVISTYLQRYMEKGILSRNRINTGWAYRKIKDILNC